MSRIQSLDEITKSLGTPIFLRWVEAPGGAAAAVVRFRHRGAVLDMTASHNFRLIFHLSASHIVRQHRNASASHQAMPAGSIVASFTQAPERIQIVGPAETLHLLFSPEIVSPKLVSPKPGSQQLGSPALVDTAPLSPRAYPALQAAAVKTLIATALQGTDAQLQHVIAGVAATIADHKAHDTAATGGLAPHTKRVLDDLIQAHLQRNITVPELAEAAGLSVHHFIKTFRHSEGFTPHALLLQRRVERAIGLLLHRSDSVEAIALTLGFSSPSHFISTFHKLVGVTPALLRRAACMEPKRFSAIF